MQKYLNGVVCGWLRVMGNQPSGQRLLGVHADRCRGEQMRSRAEPRWGEWGEGKRLKKVWNVASDQGLWKWAEE